MAMSEYDTSYMLAFSSALMGDVERMEKSISYCMKIDKELALQDIFGLYDVFAMWGIAYAKGEAMSFQEKGFDVSMMFAQIAGLEDLVKSNGTEAILEKYISS